MATEKTRRMLPVRRGVWGPPAPRGRSYVQKKASDYPALPKAYVDLMKALGSPLLIGPPICDEFVAFVQHTFTEEEASLCRHLSGMRGKTAKEVAKAEHRPVSEVEPILKRLGYEVHAIAAMGRGDKRRYRLMPVVPGIFEMVLISQHPDTITPWHRKFAELFEALYDTGFFKDYSAMKAEMIRFLPVQNAISGHPAALPTDKLEVVLDRYDTFAIGNCQCRTAMEMVGKGCGKPVENCTIMGTWAADAIKGGQARRMTRKEALEIKTEAEAHGMVSWIMNVESAKGQVSCSCCGCCCHALRQVNEFNVPAGAAPPHFMPKFDRGKCDHCGKCARTCPMGALVVDTKAKDAWQLQERCVGCGQCKLSCDKQHAITMEPVPDYRIPDHSWYSLITRSAPAFVGNSLYAWWKR